MVSDKLGAIQSMSLFHISTALLKRPWKPMLKGPFKAELHRRLHRPGRPRLIDDDSEL
jgi:hypothetical protein